MKATFKRILLVEDQPDCAFLITRILMNAFDRNCHVQHASDGDDAAAYIIGEGEYSDRVRFPFPDMVITDLNMPRSDGFSVLHLLKENPGWSIIPKIVLTTSSDPDDIRTAYMLGASAYHTKPSRADELTRCLTAIVNYWSQCEIPQVDETGRILNSIHRGKLGTRFPFPTACERMKRPQETY